MVSFSFSFSFSFFFGGRSRGGGGGVGWRECMHLGGGGRRGVEGSACSFKKVPRLQCICNTMFNGLDMFRTMIEFY